MASKDKVAAAANQEVEVSLYEAQKKIYPRSVTGVFAKWRWFFVFATQLFFYGMPWLQWGDRQAMLFDLDTRRFYIFGLVLYPQDVIYLAGILIISAMLLFLFTAVAGRQWCGYTCPQTVYTEIYLWIERKFEGDRSARLRLDASPMSLNKFWRKTGKQLAWIAVGLWTGFTFVGYFTPIRELTASLAAFSLGGWEIFWIGFYSAFLYMMAGFMREQMCKYLCPYARFQGVMFDPDTLIIAYDTERGEARGARAKGADHHAKELGDCVDCGICVQVCPTGIDIRNGLQNECIGCAACIDACDTVMDKMEYPRGLIRYSTENGVSKRYSPKEIMRRAFRPRVIIYAAVLILLTGLTAWLLAVRVPLKLNVLRDHGSLSREADDGSVENIYELKVLNTGDQTRTFRMTVEGIEGIHLNGKDMVTVSGGGIGSETVVATVAPDSAKSGANPITFRIQDINEPAVAVTEKSKFWMP